MNRYGLYDARNAVIGTFRTREAAQEVIDFRNDPTLHIVDEENEEIPMSDQDARPDITPEPLTRAQQLLEAVKDNAVLSGPQREDLIAYLEAAIDAGLDVDRSPEDRQKRFGPDGPPKAKKKKDAKPE